MTNIPALQIATMLVPNWTNTITEKTLKICLVYLKILFLVKLVFRINEFRKNTPIVEIDYTVKLFETNQKIVKIAVFAQHFFQFLNCSTAIT